MNSIISDLGIFRTRQEQILFTIARQRKKVGYKLLYNKLGFEGGKVRRAMQCLKFRRLILIEKQKDNKLKVLITLNPEKMYRMSKILSPYGWKPEWEREWEKVFKENV